MIAGSGNFGMNSGSAKRARTTVQNTNSTVIHPSHRCLTVPRAGEVGAFRGTSLGATLGAILGVLCAVLGALCAMPRTAAKAIGA